MSNGRIYLIVRAAIEHLRARPDWSRTVELQGVLGQMIVRYTGWHNRMQHVVEISWLLIPRCIAAQNDNLESDSTADS